MPSFADQLQATISAAQTPGQAQPGATGGVPSYVNMSDPVQAAVWQSFQQKGITPRDQGDFQYWVDNINKTGGFADAGNKGYWTNRMMQGSGGVGDYGQGGGVGGGAMGPGSSALAGGGASDALWADPGFQARLKYGMSGIQNSAMARGTGLSSGLMKDLNDYAGAQASNEFNNAFSRNMSIADLGYGATGQAANYLTGGASAGAAGTVGATNAIGGALNGIGNNTATSYMLGQYFGGQQ